MRALVAVLVLAIVIAASASGREDVGRPIAPCRWAVVLDAPGPQLTGVAALSDRDVWAVGDDGLRAAIVHWDGRRWRSTPSPVFALDVAAASARDVWAVGTSSPGPEASPGAEHWNGRQWSAVPVPGRPGEYLRAVASLAPTDVWAVGERARGPLLEHWNGTAWERVPGGPRDGLLHGIDARSPHAIWAVGTQGMTTPGPQSEDPLIVRWDGRRWQTLGAPSFDWVDDNLFAVDAVSASDAWAVGSVDLNGGIPLVERWDGRTWSRVPIAGLPRAQVVVSAVAAFGRDDAWIAGSSGFGPAERPLIAHWDGRGWIPVQSPLPRGGLAAVASLSSADIWAVGGRLLAEGRGRSLVERYSCTRA